MKSRWLCLVLAGLALSAGRPLVAAEPVAEFLQALRNRGYYDTAEEYLDRVERDPQTPAEIKKRIPYERALTLEASALNQRSAELQHKQLDRAAANLEQFIKNNPGHRLLGDAQSRRGRIALKKARVNVLEARSPSNAARKEALKKAALEHIATARKIFTKARDTHEKRWRAFPLHIDEAKKALLRQRKDALIDYVMAQIDLALTTYEEAQVYDRKDKEFVELLNKAAGEFEKIHQNYRSMSAGLYARMWQGKCFEEQDQIGRAIGIYKELLDHEGRSRSLERIQRQVLHFKAICDNKRRDYYLVDEAATDWLKTNRRYARTPTGLGILYERAVAREKLGMGERVGLGETAKPAPAKERPRWLRMAQEDAEFVNRFASKYKDATTLMVARIRRARGLETSEPKTFPDAYSAAQVNFNKIKQQQKALDDAKAAGKPQKDLDTLNEKLRTTMDETARLYRLSLSLARNEDSPEHINRARYVLAYLDYRQDQLFGRSDRIFDCAVLAEYVARRSRDVAPDTARDAAYLAMAAYLKLYNRAPQGRRQTEMAWIIRTARFITGNWPGSKRAVDAMSKLGAMYEKQNRPLLAADWYARIPESAKDEYSLALIHAGQAYWTHYLSVSADRLNAATRRKGLLGSVGENWAEAVADQLNPSWNVRRRHERLAELKRMFAASSAKAEREKPQPDKKKPGAEAEPAEIKRLRAGSLKELQSALPELTGRMPKDFQNRSEEDLHKLLLAELQKLSPAELKRRYQDRLKSLADDQLERLFEEKLAQWQVLAAWYLKRGVDRLSSETPTDQATPDELVAAKTSLAQYVIGRGEYKRVIAIMESAPHPVLPAIQVGDESKRPGTNSIKGRQFASLVYQLLARAYIGVRNIDEFRSYMNKLAEIAAGEDQEKVTRIFEDLGKDLQKEIERLRNRNDEVRLKDEMDNFKWVVDELFKHADQLQYNTLIWIAETSYGLGQGLGDNDDAKGYFANAANAYHKILHLGDIKPDQQTAVELRLVNCLRRQTEYPQALSLAKGVIKKNPNILRAQMEAAYALQGWGASGQTEKLMDAINGVGDDGIWGWSAIARRLRQISGRSGGETLDPAKRREYDQKYLEARYNLSWCRWKYGTAQKTKPKRRQVLGNAKRELLAFARTVGVIDGRTFENPLTRKQVDAKEKFDRLFLDIQLGMDIKPADAEKITWAEPQAAAPPPKAVAKKDDRQEPAEDSAAKKTAGQPAKKKPQESSSIWPAVGGILLTLLLFGGGGWFLYTTMGREKKRKIVYSSYAAAEPSFASLGAASPARPQRKSSSGTAAGKGAAASPTAGRRTARPGPSKSPPRKPD